jgi:hypothetical protein
MRGPYLAPNPTGQRQRQRREKWYHPPLKFIGKVTRPGVAIKATYKQDTRHEVDILVFCCEKVKRCKVEVDGKVCSKSVGKADVEPSSHPLQLRLWREVLCKYYSIWQAIGSETRFSRYFPCQGGQLSNAPQPCRPISENPRKTT